MSPPFPNKFIELRLRVASVSIVSSTRTESRDFRAPTRRRIRNVDSSIDQRIKYYIMICYHVYCSYCKCMRVPEHILLCVYHAFVLWASLTCVRSRRSRLIKHPICLCGLVVGHYFWYYYSWSLTSRGRGDRYVLFSPVSITIDLRPESNWSTRRQLTFISHVPFRVLRVEMCAREIERV